MELHIKKGSGVPVYQQIRNQIRDQILTGVLQEGFVLPPERKLAEQLDINRTTVLRAYQELKSEGIVSARVGRGTQVVSQSLKEHTVEPRDVYPILWNQYMNPQPSTSGQDIIKEILTAASKPGVLSLAAGMPDPALVPSRKFSEIMCDVTPQKWSECLSHSTVEGDPLLRQQLVELMEERDIRVPVREVMVLSGSQQGLDYAARTFVSPGDVVVVEEPTYLGALNIFRAVGARVIGVPMDSEGMRTDVLENILNRYNPRLIYTLPTFQNPSGTVMSLERRLAMLELTYRFMVPILEDDPYGELRYDGLSIPPLKALDRHGYVIYLSTFSKVLFMGARLGWVAAPRPVIDRFVQQKQLTDLHASSVSQLLMQRYLDSGDYSHHRERVRSAYKARRDVMDSILRKNAPKGLSWQLPLGGFYIWCALPEGVRHENLLECASKKGVAYVPGAAFSSTGDTDNYVRLTFARLPENQIAQGTERFVESVKECMVAATGPEAGASHRPMV